MTAYKNSIIYGVDCLLTDFTLHVLRQRGIPPCCIADGRPELVGKSYRGFTILAPETLANVHPDATVIICPTLEYWTVHDRLWSSGMTHLVPAAELLAGADPEQPGLEKTASTLRAAILAQQGQLAARRGGVFLPLVNVVTTERCTLNCRHCSNLMPLIRERRDYAGTDIAGDMGRLAQSVDAIAAAHVMGGEPFLYRDLPRLLSALADIGNLNRVSVVTNGTLIPSADCVAVLASNPKMHVFISDYGRLSPRIAELIALLNDKGIPHDRQPSGVWRDMGDLARRNRKTGEKQKIFLACGAKNCATMLDGKLYRCSRSAFGTRLGMIPEFAGEIIDLRDSETVGEQRRKISNLFYTRDFIEACDYCDGVGVDKPSVETAVQE